MTATVEKVSAKHSRLLCHPTLPLHGRRATKTYSQLSPLSEGALSSFCHLLFQMALLVVSSTCVGSLSGISV